MSGFFITAQDALREAKRPICHEINKRNGENIYDEDWDVLVLLDCARVDMMEKMSENYDFLSDISEHYTPGTSSAEWMETTFTKKYAGEMSETVHLTGNPNSANHLSADDFLHLEEVWTDGWDRDMGTIPARTITDRAIALHRKLKPKRMIVHYMQPHPPFVSRSDIEAVAVKKPGMEKTKMNVKELHEKGGYSSEELWEVHMENLEYVLDDVKLLLSNIDSNKLVISSDHGQAFGEDGVWGHPRSTNADVVRYVPWCVTSANDTREYQPEYDPDQKEPENSTTVEEKLESLGYK